MNAMTTPAGLVMKKHAQAILTPHAPLEDWPLEPDTILSGKPEARGYVISRSVDRKAVRGIWACTPGDFRWIWTYDETLLVVEGMADVELSDGTVSLKPGMMAFFERGQSSIWRIRSPLLKGFHALADEPLPF